MEDKMERNDNDGNKKVPDDNAVKSKEEEDREHVEKQVLAVMKQNRKEITPEYRQVLIERLEKARAVKNKGKKVGVKVKRTIMPDADEKQNYCSICKRSYKTAKGLKQHCQRIHGEKKMSVKIKDAEEKQQTESKGESNETIDESKKQTEVKTEDAKENKVIKPTNEVITPHVEKITDKERLLIAQQKQAQQKQAQQRQAQQRQLEQQKQAQQRLMQPTPPPSPKLTRQPPTETRYTIKEYRMMEARQKEVMKMREREIKNRARQDHIQKSIALMVAGGIR